MKRWLILILGLTLFAASVRAEDTPPIRFWAALPEPDHALMAQLVEQYNIKHPYGQVDYQNYDSKELLLEALQGDTHPDLALIDSDWISRFKDKLVPAGDILSQAGLMVRAVAKADTFKPIWDACVIDGKAYAIPFSAETAALVVNLDAFKKAPRISNLRQLAKMTAVVRKGPVNFDPLVLPLSWDKDDLGKLWIGFMESVARPQFKFWKRPKMSTLPFTLYDETAALRLWWNWIYKAKVVSADPPNSFLGGALWVLTPREVEPLQSHYKVYSLPGDKRAWGFLHVDSLAFFGSAKGWDFANFLTDYPILKLWSMHTPTVPVNKQVYLSPDYLQDVDHNRPWMRVYIGAIMRPPSWMDTANDDLAAVGDTLSKSLHNDLSVDDSVLKIHGTLTHAP